MSKDIRSFFKPLQAKTTSSSSNTNSSLSTKKKVILSDSDEDIISDTPERTRTKVPNKKRPTIIISSDSEGDSPKKKRNKLGSSKNKPETPSHKLKPVDISSVFGKTPIKQTKVEYVPKEPKEEVSKKPSNKKQGKKTEAKVHGSDDFEKTLLDLDDDIFIDNLDLFDKTIDEALAKDKGEIVEMGKKEESPSCEANKTKKKSNSEHEGDSSMKDIADAPEKSPVKKRPRKDSSSNDTPNKKTKLQHMDSGVDPDEEAYEKRRYSALLYQKYLNRSGPKHHGMKEIPTGKPDCLKDVCFLRTGVLDSLESEEFEDLIKRHGGRTVSSVSKKVNYVVVGDDPGPSKMAKAEKYNIPTLTEDELLDMIRTKSGLKPLKNPETKSEASEDLGIISDCSSEKSQSKSPKVEKVSDKPTVKSPSNQIKNGKVSPAKTKTNSSKSPAKKPSDQIKTKEERASPVVSKEMIKKSEDLKPIDRKPVVVKESNTSWTEKFKPQNIKGIIGQQGEKSNMNKLLKWLQNWHKYHSKSSSVKLGKPRPWDDNYDGSYFKCALLSGPPGVGKTTTATLVAKELGLDAVEFNASDTRSKKLLHEEVAQLLSTKSLASFAAGQKTTSTKRVLLMDEVDGMAGNQDRGGMQELINLIKNTQIPIICMCNDRMHQKVRSLANYCFDLRFAKPRLEQIRGAMMSVCCRAGVKMSPDILTDILTGTNCDIRQTLNNLAMWSAGNQTITAEVAKKESKVAVKDTVIGPFEVVRKVFTQSEQQGMTYMDKSQLFFYDYSLGPLFVQENYVKVKPKAKTNVELLKKCAAAADAISMGDIIDANIRRSNNWSLLEVQALFSSVLPGHHMRGQFDSRINFPEWLGKNSKKNKYNRMLSELQIHTRTTTSASKMAIKLDYLTPLRNAIVRPLKEGPSGIDKAVEVMKHYNLLRDDYDNLLELSSWPKLAKSSAVSAEIESKVKAAFTRNYNKQVPLLPYAPGCGVPKKKIVVSEFLNEEDAADLESDPEDDSIENDAMIKKKVKKTQASSSSKNSNSKGKGKGKKTK